MNESIFKKIWNYSITVGQMIMTAIVSFSPFKWLAMLVP